ncbi:hypothetical protein [Silvibacterium acidisoli]|uniref:hypothetical protein n=1 Tax=Acidobacteriaceae bacterium ZG23-2 TaxID=2883246 RepID=UPI00406CF408
MSFSRRGFLRAQLAPAALAFLPRTLLAEAAKPLGTAAITCEGSYPGHLQGICTNNRDSVYWAFTTVLVKTDANGKVMKKIPVVAHHGAPCYLDGKVYVPVNLAKFDDATSLADSWVYVYDAADLTLLSKHKAGEAIYGAGGIYYHNNKFLVVGGLPEGFNENYLYEYDRDLKFLRKITLHSGYTTKGIQTAAFNDGYWWFGCYGSPHMLLKVDENFSSTQKFVFDCALGIVPVGPSRFLVARGNSSCAQEGGCRGQLIPAEVNKTQGLSLRSVS